MSLPAPGSIEIRRVAAGDHQAVVAIIRSVRDRGDTYAMDASLGDDALLTWWIDPPPRLTVVALVHGEVVGTAKAGPNRPGRGAHVATASFMVAEAGRGRGVGRALATHVLAWAREAGFAAMQFNAVVETNTAAVHLWQELGFCVIGTVPAAFDHPEHGRVGLHVMHRFLGDDPGA